MWKAILSIFHYEAKFDHLRSLYNEQGLMIVLLAGLTPIPYKVFTILSGAVGASVLIAASVAARGLRFFAVGNTVASVCNAI